VSGEAVDHNGDVWERIIPKGESLLWKGQMGLPLGPVSVLGFLFFAAIAYHAAWNIFVYSSLEEACPPEPNGRCAILYFFAWPVLAFMTYLLCKAVYIPIAMWGGCYGRRYAIAEKSAYVHEYGLRETIRSERLLTTMPHVSWGVLIFSQRVYFGGLSKTDISSAIEAAQKQFRVRT
jgi:hypothetical protein